MSKETVSLSDHTSVGLPIRNLIGLATAVALGTWAWFGLQERLNKLETNQILMQKSVEQNENFRIKWPRGELGALPADAEQFMLLEHLAKEFSKLQKLNYNQFRWWRMYDVRMKPLNNRKPLRDRIFNGDFDFSHYIVS